MKGKKFVSIATAFLALTAMVAPLTSVRNSVAKADNETTPFTGVYSQNFDEVAQLPDGYEIKAENAGSTAYIKDGALEVASAGEGTEIKLPVQAKNFVLEFDCTRIYEENTMLFDRCYCIPVKPENTKGLRCDVCAIPTANDLMNTTIGVKYKTAESKNGYEMLLHTAQKDTSWGDSDGDGYYTPTYTNLWTGSSYTSLATTSPLSKFTGHGLENWHNGEKNTTLLMFNYYNHEFYLNETFRFRLQISDTLVELYIKGEDDTEYRKYLKDILTEEESGQEIILRVDGKCTARFDNLFVYSESAYAEKMIAALPEIAENQTEDTVNGYKKQVNAVQTFVAQYLGGKSTEISNYSVYTQKVQALETLYGAKPSDKPVLTVKWRDIPYETETDIKVPLASAVSAKGEKLAVKVEVFFDGKLVKTDKDNKFTANEAGDYTVRYIARDLQGNTTEETHTITVTQKPVIALKKDYTGGILLGVSISAVVLVLGANAVLLIANGAKFVVRRKKR